MALHAQKGSGLLLMHIVVAEGPSDYMKTAAAKEVSLMRIVAVIDIFCPLIFVS